jgi:phospholipase/lecithinase/hemolysin
MRRITVRKAFWIVALLAVAILAVPAAHADTFDAIYAFGDSLSDVGNDFTLTGGAYPASPYVNGQFSNGNIWAQDLASDLGLPALTPSVLGGTDYAYGGAETAVSSYGSAPALTDLLGTTGQIAQFDATHPTADPNALYTIWVGSNDLLGILSSGATPSHAAADAAVVAGNIDTAINSLAASGARDFLVLTVPNLGVTPEVQADGAAVAAAASALAAEFDSTLVNGGGPVPSLSALATTDSVDISVLNTYSLLDSFVGNPAYGFTNVTSPCYTGTVEGFADTSDPGTVCSQ